ncbi:g025 [Yersinia phage fHe-Yen9-04]|uniref:G025 protein n=1 Tax=Yersinia phage fHe-Yen9-04 TaxID=2052742 RepID=A0A2C9CZ59_9CAUD|nr:hypothetical protein FDJ41_gp025 [Yersinia phage fHe-Yen9-04]SOK58302.1 g025 [Yersinia phage fHe-Yen9-04]VUE36071.1 g025 [Yersinia phage fHe-Yen9-04]
MVTHGHMSLSLIVLVLYQSINYLIAKLVLPVLKLCSHAMVLFRLTVKLHRMIRILNVSSVRLKGLRNVSSNVKQSMMLVSIPMLKCLIKLREKIEIIWKSTKQCYKVLDIY